MHVHLLAHLCVPEYSTSNGLTYSPSVLLPIPSQDVIDPAGADVGTLALVHAAVAPSDAVVEGQPQCLRGQHRIIMVDGFDDVILNGTQRDNYNTNQHWRSPGRIFAKTKRWVYKMEISFESRKRLQGNQKSQMKPKECILVKITFFRPK